MQNVFLDNLWSVKMSAKICLTIRYQNLSQVFVCMYVLLNPIVWLQNSEPSLLCLKISFNDINLGQNTKTNPALLSPCSTNKGNAKILSHYMILWCGVRGFSSADWGHRMTALVKCKCLYIQLTVYVKFQKIRIKVLKW